MPGTPREIDRAVTAFAREPNGGLIVTAGPSTVLHRDLIVSLAARHKLPAVYFDRTSVSSGGLISYGPMWWASSDKRRAMSTAS